MLFFIDKELQRLRIAMKSLLVANDEKVRGHVTSDRAGCVCVCSECVAGLNPTLGGAAIRSSSSLKGAPPGLCPPTMNR